jgi:hypothetical protein
MVGWEPFLYSWSAANNIVRALPTETVTIGESLGRQTAKTRTRNESPPIVIGESVGRQTGRSRPIATQTVTIGETLNRIRGHFKTLSESVTIGESTATVRGKSRAISESITIGESVLRGRPLTKTLSESVDISEAVNRLKSVARSLFESTTHDLSTYEAEAYEADAYDTAVTEGVFDIVARIKGAIRSPATQSILISESISREKSGQRSVSLGVAQEIVISDSINRRTGKRRIIVDNATPPAVYDADAFESDAYETVSHEISDSISKSRGVHRILSQNVFVSDGIVTYSRTLARAIIETVTILSNVTRQLTRSRPLSTESVSISDSISKTLGKTRIIAETVTISELLETLAQHTGTVIRTITEPLVTIGESLSRQLDKARSMESDENVEISDSVEAIKNYVEPIIIPETERKPQIINIKGSVWRNSITSKSKVEDINEAENQHRLIKYLRHKLRNNWLSGI